MISVQLPSSVRKAAQKVRRFYLNCKDYTKKFGGTLEYMAPELIYTADTNPYVCQDPRAVDYWGLGCVLYEMIANHSPFNYC